MKEVSEVEVSWLLEQEGFNEYQQKAFKAMLALKAATASEVSAKSGVPEAKVYEVLRSLEGKGLVSSAVGRPKKFALQNPEKALAASLQAKQQAIEREKGVLERVARLAAQAPPSNEGAITLLRGREAVLRHLVSYMKENLSRSCDACFPFANAYNPMTEIIKQKAAEGVRIRLLGEVTPDNYGIVKRYLKCGVELRNCRKIAPPQPLRFSVYDDRAANFTLTDVERDYITIWTDSLPVVRSISDLFTYYWSNGLRVD